MKKAILFLAMGGILLAGEAARSGDFKDGIGEVTDESIEADEALGDKDTNLKFIVAGAVADAKRSDRKKGGKKSSKKLIHQNDGSNPDNQNSVVVGPGSNVDTVINIVEEK